MTNLAPPSAPAQVVPPAAPPEGVLEERVSALLDDVRAARTESGPLPGLEPATYARTHAAFELLSDQRRLIGEHLGARMASRSEGPVSVLAVGCGDGTLDAPLAAGLADVHPARAVRYVGVDPFAGSTTRFAARMGALARPTLDVETRTTTFEALDLAERFDVVTFVHSIYYVRDVAATLRAAHDLLRPGGELLVLVAPRAELNALVEVLAPPLEGHEQWFSDDVARAWHQAGLPVEPVVTLEAGLDVAAADEEVLDFTVQARLTPHLRDAVRRYLDAVAVPGAEGPRVPHPVDVHRLVRRG